MRCAKAFALFLSVLLVVVGAPAPAHAALPDVDVAECLVTGNATHTPIGLLPAFAAYAAALTMACVVAGNGDDGGNWTLTVTAAGALESCAEGFGAGVVTGGTSANDGGVTGGGFTYVRAGNAIHVVGTINTALDTPAHSFSADLVYVPTVPGCPDSGAGTVTGTLTLTDGQNPPDADGQVCTVNAAINYGPPFVLNGLPAPTPFAAVFNMNCVVPNDDAGLWGFGVNGFASSSCELESAVAPITWFGPAGGDGAVTGGNVTWVRVGPVLLLTATILAAGETHHLAAVMAWNPFPGPVCGVPPTFAAAATGPGALVDA